MDGSRLRLNCPLMPSPPSPWSSRQHERAEDAPASDSNVRMRRIQMAVTLIVLALPAVPGRTAGDESMPELAIHVVLPRAWSLC